ncbi:MAG: BON domain-containing protein [Chloroflexi bacterium]|nr:BON domain-containing protein [Chloroflexota bacterium]
MDHSGLSHHQALEFLREQAAETDHKITRLRNALETCHDDLEANGLTTMLHTAEMERDLLRDLLASQSGDEAVSLEAAIMQMASRFRQQAAQLSDQWQRGQSTPPAYWDAEAKQAFLLNLLRRFHASQPAKNGSAPETTANGKTSNGAAEPELGSHAHPWFDANHLPARHLSDAPGVLENLTKAIQAALHQVGCPEHHVEIVVQPEGLVIATGYVHSASDRERIFTAIMGVEDVWEVVSDIKITAPTHCPACAG